MDICFCILANYESNNLLLDIGGLTYIKRTYLQVKKSRYFNNNIFILTNDELIKKELYEYENECNFIITDKNYINAIEKISKNPNI
jgi:CMP-2-keto-3-deoxyoctulosonic acid synthetase